MGRVKTKRAATATWSGASKEATTLVDDLSVLNTFKIPGGRANGLKSTSVDAVIEVAYGPLAQGSGEVIIDRPVARLGSYRLLEILGEGGMARVYLAEHVFIRKRVAIKTLLPEFCTYGDAHDVLMREARIAALIRHPHMVEIFDFAFDARGCPYYVMELASGETLARRLERGPLLLSQALDVIIRVADVIAAVHRAGYLHRDIKSENVILTQSGRRRSPKLIDFGIARPISPSPEERVEGMVGTPRTMAPEQISLDDIDERTDIWALGILFYEMLTGEQPFSTHENVRDDLVAIVTESPRPLPLGLGGDVCRIIESCLSKDREDRPPSAEVLVARLRRAQADYVSRHELIERTLRTSEVEAA